MPVSTGQLRRPHDGAPLAQLSQPSGVVTWIDVSSVGRRHVDDVRGQAAVEHLLLCDIQQLQPRHRHCACSRHWRHCYTI